MKRPEPTTTNASDAATTAARGHLEPGTAPKPKRGLSEQRIERRENGMSRGEKGLLVAASLALLALAGAGAWQFQRGNALPPLAIPTPVLPTPNAYDDYLRAANLVVSVIGGGDATGEPSILTGGAKTLRSGSPLPSVTARRKLVALNAPAIESLRRGFAHSFARPPERSPSAVSGPGLNGTKARALARMLAYAARTELDAGQPYKAAVFCLDGVRFATDAPRGGGFMERLVARSCEATARKPLWEIAAVCDAQTARTVVRRLEEIERNRHPLTDTLRDEKYIGLVSLRNYLETEGVHSIAKEVASGRGATIGPPRGVGGTTLLSPVAVGTIQAQIMVKGKGRILADYGAYMDRVIATSRAPYGAHVPLPPPPPDPVNKDFFALEMDNLFLRDAEARMMARLLTVRFALQAYRLERGGGKTYPQTLAALASLGYLRAVPSDPFAAPGASGVADAPIGYRRISGKDGGADTFVLYSVGPDGKDNRGAPINNRYPTGRFKGRQKNLVEAGTKGDFVVGVNAY